MPNTHVYLQRVLIQSISFLGMSPISFTGMCLRHILVLKNSMIILGMSELKVYDLWVSLQSIYVYSKRVCEHDILGVCT